MSKPVLPDSRPRADLPTPLRAFLKWALIGVFAASALVITQWSAVGGLKGLPQFGAEMALRPAIEEELGEVPLADGAGHDGQIYYAIALDLDGDELAQLLPEPAYRYRRIMFPAISSLFGFLDGEALIVGMVATVIVSSGLAAGSVAASARLLGGSDWLALAAILNPGLWLSVRLLTADVLATALMALGITGFLAARRWTLVAFALSALSKDYYLLTPGGMAVSRDRSRWKLLVAPLLALMTWVVWVRLTIDSGFQGEANNLAVPFTGIVKAIAWWPDAGFENWLYVLFALVVVVAALLVGALSRGLLRWSLLGWAVLGLCSSWYVWRIGNNAARAFAPVLVLLALHMAQRRPARVRSGTYSG